MTAANDPAPAGQSPTAITPPPVDRAKVERLKAAIESGNYSIDTELIAEKLIETGFPGALTESKLTETAVTGPDN